MDKVETEIWRGLSSRSFEESLASLIWDQWYSIGGSASARKGQVPFAVDIEALILATTRFGNYDSRIWEQCIDWLALNGKLVSLQRLKNIQKAFQIGDPELVADLGEFMVAQKFPNWKTVSTVSSAVSTRLRDRSISYEIRNLSHRPNPDAAEAFLFKLRNFFGMSARAEVFLWLFTHNTSGHPAEIAKETSWLPKTIQLVLNEWEQSGLVHSYSRGREKKFTIRSADWSVLNPGQDEIGWMNQPRFYAGCRELLTLLAELEELSEASEEMKSITIRNRIATIRDHFVDSSMASFFERWSPRLKGGEAVETFFEEATKIAAAIDARVNLATVHGSV